MSPYSNFWNVEDKMTLFEKYENFQGLFLSNYLVPRPGIRGAIPPLPLYVFMALCLVKHRDNFTFTFTFSSKFTLIQLICYNLHKHHKCSHRQKYILAIMFMEQRPSWEANNHSARQEIHRHLWKPRVQSRVHKKHHLFLSTSR
jgi:hypothetical protein